MGTTTVNTQIKTTKPVQDHKPQLSEWLTTSNDVTPHNKSSTTTSAPNCWNSLRPESLAFPVEVGLESQASVLVRVGGRGTVPGTVGSSYLNILEYILEHNMGLCLFSSTSKGAANTVCHPEISQTGLLRLWWISVQSFVWNQRLRVCAKPTHK